ncbi:MAG: hypothetical protein GQ564_00325 [Bacteroidales bacterium]|nr:hypothetical protein [Bacteroidales bacterium]
MLRTVKSKTTGITYQFEYNQQDEIVYLRMPNGAWIGVGENVKSYVDAQRIAQHHVDTQIL